MNRAAPASKPNRSTLGVALILAVMVWLAAKSDDWRHAFGPAGTTSDYYGLLAQGFREGHLYLKTNGNLGLLDTSLYHERLYLYFGVVPAALLFLPYLLLTGHDLPANVAVILTVSLGFLLYLQIYRNARQRYFPSIPRYSNTGCVLLLAFGSSTPFLLTADRVYEIAVSSAYLCLAAAWFGIFRAWHSDRHAARWLALASLALGLAVGCRPNFAFALPVLLAAAIVILRRNRNSVPAILAATIIPAALVGAALAAYNYGRFGNPLEFGFTYQMSSRSAKLASLAFFWSNLDWYYFHFPVFTPYFPYILPHILTKRPEGYSSFEPLYGQVAAVLLLVICAIGSARQRLRPSRLPHGLRDFLGLVAAMFVCLLLSLAFFSMQADRYMVDFDASLVLLIVLVGGYCAAEGPSGGWSRSWRASFFILATACSAASVMGSLQLENVFQKFRPRSYGFLAYYGNYPSYFLAQKGLLHYGAVRFRIRLPRTMAPSVRETLLSTGMPAGNDLLYVERSFGKSLELTLVHEGYGELRSGPIPAEPGSEYEIEAALGSLYPPKNHPYFRGWSQRDIDELKTTAWVSFNGEKVIEEHLPPSDSPPGPIHLGRNPASTDPQFSGKIVAARQRALPDAAAFRPPSQPGVWRLKLQIPPLPPGVNYPLLASGVTGDGNMLVLQVTRDQRLRFGLDQWGIGMDVSPPLSFGPGPHRLEIFIGPQVATQKLPNAWGINPASLKDAAAVMRLWLDGVAVWTVPIQYHQDSYDWVSVGSNPQGFSSAGPFFVGGIKSLPYSTEQMQEFIAKNLPKADK